MFVSSPCAAFTPIAPVSDVGALARGRGHVFAQELCILECHSKLVKTPCFQAKKALTTLYIDTYFSLFAPLVLHTSDACSICLFFLF